MGSFVQDVSTAGWTRLNLEVGLELTQRDLLALLKCSAHAFGRRAASCFTVHASRTKEICEVILLQYALYIEQCNLLFFFSVSRTSHPLSIHPPASRNEEQSADRPALLNHTYKRALKIGKYPFFFFLILRNVLTVMP